MNDKKLKIITEVINTLDIAAALPAELSWDLIIIYSLLAIKAEVAYRGLADASKLNQYPFRVFSDDYTAKLLAVVGLTVDRYGDIVAVR